MWGQIEFLSFAVSLWAVLRFVLINPILAFFFALFL